MEESATVSRNRRNGCTGKTNSGDLAINVPRDRNSEFKPLLIQKHKRRLEGIDDVVVKPLLLVPT